MLTTSYRSDASTSSAADRRDACDNGNGKLVSCSTPLSIWETGDRIQVEIDLPGLTAEGIDLSFKNGMLWIRGERSFSHRDGQLRYNDRWFGPFERLIKLPDMIDPASIEAEFRDGVLLVTLAKTPESQPRKVKVRAG